MGGLERINWDDVKARMNRLSDLVESGESWTEAEARAILRERAHVLAKRDELGEAEATIDLVSFTIAGESFALHTAYVREVAKVTRYVAAPCAPPFLLGIINSRGTLLPVVDFGPVFGLRPWDAVIANILVLGDTTPEMAVATEAVRDVITITRSSILPIPESVDASARHFMVGATQDAITVLDGRTILHDPAFRVA